MKGLDVLEEACIASLLGEEVDVDPPSEADTRAIFERLVVRGLLDRSLPFPQCVTPAGKTALIAHRAAKSMEIK